MRTLLLTFFIFLTILSNHQVFGVKKYLFRTCDQNPFCKRNRHYADKVSEASNSNVQWKSPYDLPLSSISMSNGQLIGTVIKTVNDIRIELPLTLSFLQSGSVRLSIDEKQRSDGTIEVYGSELVSKQRFNVSEYAFAGPLELDQEINQFSQISDNEIEVVYDDNRIIIQLNPLTFTFHRHGEEQVVLNEKGFLNYEHWRPIEGEDVDKHVGEFEIDDGIWEDDFDGHKDKKTRGPESISLDVSFKGYRDVYGIPEHADRLSLKETRGGDLNHEDPYRLFNVDIFEYETNSPMSMYGSIPFMQAHKKSGSAGIFWANAADTYIDISKDKKSTTSHWISETGLLDVFVFLGDKPSDITKQYGLITGFAMLPQTFAIAYHQCRWNYNSQEDVLDVHDNFDLYGIPYDVIWLDIEYANEKKYFTWNKDLFPDHIHMMNQLDITGRKLVPIIDPHIKVSDNDLGKAVKEQNLIVLNSDGEQFHGHCWPGQSVWVDPFKPSTRQYWSELFSTESEFGGQCPNLHIWNDMNEPSVFDGPETSMPKSNIHFGGWEHRDLHNLNGMLVHNATLEGLDRRYSYQQRPFVLTRSYFAGSQRLGAMWTGDNMAKWEYLQVATPMILTSGLSGMPFAGADVGGFFGDPSPELLTRWYQAGAFYPFFRAHAHIDAKRREPWMGEKPYNTTIRDAVRLRYNLLPTMYTAFYQASVDNTPVLKPMFYVVPNNEKVFAIDDQYFVGDSGILVKPVTEEGATSVDIYIPDDEVYFDFYDDTNHQKYTGEGLHKVEAPLSKTPVLLRGGHIHVRRDRYRRSSKLMKYDPYTLVVTVDRQGRAKGQLYVDDGESYEYKDGKYILQQFTFDGKVLSGINQVKTSGEKYEQVSVEKIIFIGLKNKPEQATISQDGQQWTAEIQAQNGEIIIRNPRMQIGLDWIVEL